MKKIVKDLEKQLNSMSRKEKVENAKVKLPVERIYYPSTFKTKSNLTMKEL